MRRKPKTCLIQKTLCLYSDGTPSTLQLYYNNISQVQIEMNTHLKVRVAKPIESGGSRNKNYKEITILFNGIWVTTKQIR